MEMPSRRTNNFPESGRGLGHVTPTIFGSTVGYPSDSLASCLTQLAVNFGIISTSGLMSIIFTQSYRPVGYDYDMIGEFNWN